MKTIAITGASGFVGTNINRYFKNNYKIIPITRDILNDESKLKSVLEESDVIINLAGANIIGRWTPQYKELLYSSRIDTTKKIVNILNQITDKNKLLISTSAVGIYDNTDTHDENGTFANDFLSNLCQDWEKEALKAKSSNVKVSIFRFGIVLGLGGGAFAKMLTPFKFGLGGIIGSGNQAFSYIHINDLLRAYEFVITKDLEDTFNLTAPKPTTNLLLTRTLGKALGRPTVFPVPEFVLKLIFSEGAKVLTDGQDVVPKKLLSLGFKFDYCDITETVYGLI